MKRIIATVVALAVLVLAGLPLGTVSAQVTGFSSTYITSITFQNISTVATTVNFEFYDQESGTAIPHQEDLSGSASKSLFVGSLTNVTEGFQGSAVMSADQQVIATMVQIGEGDQGLLNRPLSNGFTAGASNVLIATVLKNTFNQTTVFSVQNVGDSPASGTVSFFAVGESAAAHTEPITNLPAGAAQYFDASEISELGDSFNGSATVAMDSGAVVVAAALELGTGGDNTLYTTSFEGIVQGGQPLFMPSALCNGFGQEQTTFYAVQNNTGSAADITVTYTNAADGAEFSETITGVANGGKASFNTCNASDGSQTIDEAYPTSPGFSGSAQIEASVDGELVAIGKVAQPGYVPIGIRIGGLSTTFLGETTGASVLYGPYARWATDANYDGGSRTEGQRAFIAIQNVGSAPVDSITVEYLDPDGNVQGDAHVIAGPIAVGAKVNSNPSESGLAEFGYPNSNPSGGFGGGVRITGPDGSQLIATIRIASRDLATGKLVGEDYNGVAGQ
ncbi:MAG: hypothetical protein HC837_21635 [Chloroflexaceae bacterium]|nr:hypothetical protein [Chloroflexaceae bacterium]